MPNTNADRKLSNLLCPEVLDRQRIHGHFISLLSGEVSEPILDWMEKHIRYPKSDWSNEFKRDTNPVWNWIYEQFTTGDYRLISIIAPTGAGKSTFIESLISYLICNDPGDTLIVTQTDDDALKWANQRLLPMFNNVEAVKTLLPKDRTKKKKESIEFGHMNLDIGGANENTLQSVSKRWLFGDEIWKWKSGLVTEFSRRDHDRPNATIFLFGQGGEQGDEHETAHSKTTRHVYGWHCPKCKQWQRYTSKPRQLTYKDIKDAYGNRILADILKTVAVKCEHCGVQYKDTYANRHRLAASGQFRMHPDYQPHAVRHKLGLQFHAMAVPWIPWSKLVEELLDAYDQKQIGNYTPMRQYKQKRAAEIWNAATDIEVPRVAIQSGDYTHADYQNGEPLDNEIARFMAIDVQDKDYYAIIRAWRNDGSSRLLYADRINTEPVIIDTANRYNILAPAVCADANYGKHRVHPLCAGNGYTGLIGSRFNQWQHTDRRGNKTKRPYSVAQIVSVLGSSYLQILFSNLYMKDILHVLRLGRLTKFEVPRDIHDEYLKHQNVEERKEIRNKDGTLTTRWANEYNRPNHYYDCEVMGVTMAVMAGILILDENFSIDNIEPPTQTHQAQETQNVRHYKLKQK